MNARALHVRLFVAGFGLVLLAGAEPAATQGASRTIFVSVVDGNGKPVTDMTVADFAIREDQVDREVLSAKKSEQPMAIALLVDTTTEAEEYVNDIRNGVKAFVQQILAANPKSEIALWEFGQAAIPIKGFTSSLADLEKEASRIFPKPRASSVLLEGIHEVSNELARQKTPRRAMVIVNVEPSNEISSQEPMRVQQALIRSRAQMWAVSVQKGNLKNPQRDVVLNRLAQIAGGRREFILTQSAISTWLTQYADALANQYEVTYNRPSGKPQIVQVGARRDGVKVIAGIAAPQ